MKRLPLPLYQLIASIGNPRHRDCALAAVHEACRLQREADNAAQRVDARLQSPLIVEEP